MWGYRHSRRLVGAKLYDQGVEIEMGTVMGQGSNGDTRTPAPKQAPLPITVPQIRTAVAPSEVPVKA